MVSGQTGAPGLCVPVPVMADIPREAVCARIGRDRELIVPVHRGRWSPATQIRVLKVFDL